MTTYSKHTLSGSTDGKNIIISASASPGTLIHTADSTDLDEVWIYANNTTATLSEFTVQWGEETEPNGNIVVSIPSEEGLLLIIPGFLITNSLNIKGFCSASPINVNGFVNRISNA